MDKSSHSSCGESSSISTSATSSSTNSNTNSTTTAKSTADHYLKNLNKLSHKISKPTPPPPTVKNNHFPKNQTPQPPAAAVMQQGQTQQQHQPPVYNISKSDFRDVVQKLTGSPAHERFSTPQPIHQPKPPSSRLQRIRPPPLSQVNSRPPELLNGVHPPPQQPNTASLSANHFISSANTAVGSGSGNIIGGQRQPLSPLPPFPAVHAAAESPISAYIRYLQSSIAATDSNSKQFSGLSPLAPLASPTWHGLAAGPQLPTPSQQQNIPLPPAASSMPQLQFPMTPSSLLPFGCLPSPKSPYPLLSPSLLLSPNGQLGSQQLPLSPTLPVPTPKWKRL